MANPHPQEQVALAVAVPSEVPWTTGLSGCCENGGLCCDAFWCLLCMQSRLYAAAANNETDTMDPAMCLVLGMSVAGGAALSTLCPLQCAAAGSLPCLVSCGIGVTVRGTVRRRFDIKGDACSDACAALFCQPCAACQHHEELAARGIDPGYTCCRPAPPRQAALLSLPPENPPVSYGGALPQAQPGYSAQPLPQPAGATVTPYPHPVYQ